MIKEDRDELLRAISLLKMDMFKGHSIQCPKCERKGSFGSVVLYQCESEQKYILCGWCGNITKEMKE